MADREGNFLALWRKIAAATVTFLIVFTVLIDTLGRLFVDPTFHVSEVIFGTLVAFWASLLLIEGANLIRRNGNGS